MSEHIRTAIDLQRPSFYVEMIDGRVTLIQFGRVPDDLHDAFCEHLKRALSQAFVQHGEDMIAAVRAQLEREQPRNPDRDFVLRFVDEQLTKAAASRPLPRRRTFPEVADGRDPSGQVHVSLTRSAVMILEAPVGTFADPRRGAQAVGQACNLAFERLERDMAEYIARQERLHPPSAPAPMDWSKLADQIARLPR